MLIKTIKLLVFLTVIFAVAVFAQVEPQALRRTVEKEIIEPKASQPTVEKKCDTGDFDCIIERETAIIKKSGFKKNRLIRGLAYYKKGDIEKALVDLENTDYIYIAEGNLFLGNIYLSQAKFNQARKAFDRAIRQNPNLAEAYVGRGNVYLYERIYESAIEDFDRAVFINARLSKAYFGLGLCYLKIGYQLQEAKAEQWEITEAYNKAVKNFDSVEEIDLSKADPVIFFKRALAYEALGFKERAENDRRKFNESGKSPEP